MAAQVNADAELDSYLEAAVSMEAEALAKAQEDAMLATQTFAWTASGAETDLEAQELDLGPQLGTESLA